MSGWPRKTFALFLAAVVAVGVSCTSDEALGPSQPSTPPALSAADGEPQSALLTNLLGSLRLLSCTPQPYAVRTQSVGTAGGTIVVGTHRLVIPAGALKRSYTIRAEQVTGNVNSVRFSPEGLTFAKPAKLTLSYGNCSSLLILKKIVYTSELLQILELLPSIDNVKTKTVTGDIRHFSRYAVAW